ncbi:MAG: LysR substrate-binding domain-containing protein [Sphingobium sp.]
MDRISDMQFFTAVIDAGGIGAGGRRLGLSPASASERLAGLEARSGARLLVRTTRSLTLTDEGQLFLEAARGILAEIADLDARLRDGANRISGRIRVETPVDLGRNRIAPILDMFMAAHPDVSVELILGDGFSDLVREGIDFALRFGALADTSLVTRRIGPNRRLPCASPSYIARHGTPRVPAELAEHDCLVMQFGNRPDDRWRFRGEQGDIVVQVKGRRKANDGDLIRQWAVAGHGIAMKSVWDVGADIAAGRLVELLPDHSLAGSALQIIYPAGRQLPRRSRALMDAVVLGLDRLAG